MSIVTSRASIIVELAEALGVPKSAKSFTLHVEANSPLTLTVVHYLDESNICSLVKTIKKFELREEQ